MDAQHSQRIQDLKQSFKVFNQVSQRLEATYHHLEDQVVQLRSTIKSEQSDTRQTPAISNPEADRYRAILMALPAGVVVLDATGHVQECNPTATALLGEPLLGEVWTQVINREFAPRSDDGHEISLKNGRRVSIATCPIGETPGQVLLLTDVTQTRDLQNHVSQHQRLIAMGEMAASLAHQIRTPLATGLLFTAQLKNPSLDNSARISVAEKVMTQLRHLETLINDMLMFSRTGYGGNDVISLQQFLGELGNAVTPLCEQRSINLEIVCEAPEGFVKGNANSLHSALLNLANNAVQAMGYSGKLQLHVRKGVCNTVEICVIDNGPGIATDIQDKLFKPFFTTRRDGTGLGLAVVNAVARAHGGSVRLESKEGLGSEFIVRLPLLPESGSDEMSPAQIFAENQKA